MVTGEGEPPKAETTASPAGSDGIGQPIDAGTAGQPIGGEVEITAELPELEGRALGPAVETPGTVAERERIAAAAADLEQVKLTIRELNREATKPKNDKATRHAADVALKEVAKTEYGRPDGGREPIKRILSRYGYGNPNK